MGVSYSASPKSVIALLEDVAGQHPDILKNPKLWGLFVEFGNSSINFESRAWTTEFDDWQRVRSELASAIFEAVKDAGMSFPFPQREVRLLNDSEKETEGSSLQERR